MRAREPEAFLGPSLYRIELVGKTIRVKVESYSSKCDGKDSS